MTTQVEANIIIIETVQNEDQYRPFYNASTSRNPFLDFSAKRKISFWIQIILIWIPHNPPPLKSNNK